MSTAKRRVAVLGATGLVGQRLIRRLLTHPLFELVAVGGSPRQAGATLGEVTSLSAGGDLRPEDLPSHLAGLVMRPCVPGADFPCELVFSVLPTEVACEVEPAFAAAGYVVVSNASAHRMESDVPLIIPEVNPEHLALVARQQRNRNWRGFIVTNPNCSSATLTLALAPLARAFGLEAVQVMTLQALSGAGKRGPSALAMLDNVLPYIAGEEAKLESEPRKLLGALGPDGIAPFPVEISAHCNRVGTLHGHLECVSVKLSRPAAAEEVLAAWWDWRPLQNLGLDLPSAPPQPIVLRSEPDRPQPRLDRDLEHGMVSVVGRLRPDPVFDYKFVVLGHNLARGAAGGTVLIAELLHTTGYLQAEF